MVIEWPEKSNQNTITQHGCEAHVVEVAWRQEVTREGCAREDLGSSVSHQALKEVMVLISWKRRKDSSTRAAGTMGKQGRLFHCLLPLFYNSAIICCCYSFPRFYYCQLVWGCDFWMSAFRLLYGFDLSVYSNIIFIWMHIILEGKEF